MKINTLILISFTRFKSYISSIGYGFRHRRSSKGAVGLILSDILASLSFATSASGGCSPILSNTLSTETGGGLEIVVMGALEYIYRGYPDFFP